MAKLLKFQTSIPRGEWYQCQYYFAQSQAGDKKLALSGAKSLFLSGESVSSACDPLFNFLKDNGKLTGGLYLDRMLLAYEHHNYRLMKYLNKQLDGRERKVGDLILDLYLNPDKVADFAKKSRVTPYNQKLTELTFQRLARKDAKKAIEQYSRTMQGQHYSAAKKQQLAEYVASRLMATDKPELGEWRDQVLSKTSRESLLERRIRQAMREGDWNSVDVWINRLPANLKASNRWRYWEARLLDSGVSVRKRKKSCSLCSASVITTAQQRQPILASRFTTRQKMWLWTLRGWTNSAMLFPNQRADCA